MARKILFMASSDLAVVALKKKDLHNLGAFEAEGQICVDGGARRGHLVKPLGTTRIRVIMPEEPLAKLIVLDAHREDHRKPLQSVIASSRRKAGFLGEEKRPRKQWNLSPLHDEQRENGAAGYGKTSSSESQLGPLHLRLHG